MKNEDRPILSAAVSSLQILSSEPPLHLRREELANKYAIKLQSYHPIRRTTPSFTSNLLLYSTPNGELFVDSAWACIAPSYSLLNTNNTPIAVNKLSPIPRGLIKPP